MTKAQKLLRLKAVDRKLLLKTLSLLWAIRLGLWILPFNRLRNLLVQWSSKPSDLPKANEFYRDRVSWAVATAERFIPGKKTCLVQALAVQVMLTRRALPADLRLGVVKDESEGLRAHAWVESDGVIVIGGQGLEQYVPLKTSRESSRTPPSEPSPASPEETDP
ncbi:lasso peptide biosynthesis B2 protein [Thermodesulfobacteriota bacterium]